MNLNFVPKLEHMANVKIIVSLWNHYLSTSFENHSIWSLPSHWVEVEDNIKREVSRLLLPEELKQRAKNLVRVIGHEILRWEIVLKGRVNPNNVICWTPHGAIDEKRTAELLAKDHDMDVVDRYKLACKYCLEKDVRLLWYVLPDEYRTSICDQIISYFIRYMDLAIFWTCVMEDKVESMYGRDVSPFPKLFIRALNCNQSAAEYFFLKLSVVEQKEALDQAIAEWIRLPLLKVMDARSVCFLLIHMDEEQRTKMFKLFSQFVLQAFLPWPWQDLFMEVANSLWNFLPKFNFGSIFAKIVSKLECGLSDYNYKKLLTEFWLQSPEAHKQYVFSKDEFVVVLETLFIVDNDKHIIQLILKYATVNNLEKMISHCDNIINDKTFVNGWVTVKDRCTLEEKKQWQQFCEILELIHDEKKNNGRSAQ